MVDFELKSVAAVFFLHHTLRLLCLIRNNSPNEFAECHVITHLLSDTRLFCDVYDLDIAKDLVGDQSANNYKLRVYINGIEIGTSPNIRFRTNDTPRIKYFEYFGTIDPSQSSKKIRLFFDFDFF